MFSIALSPGRLIKFWRNIELTRAGNSFIICRIFLAEHLQYRFQRLIIAYPDFSARLWRRRQNSNPLKSTGGIV
ncbi:hypothetical protein JY97_17305 [Alkalispirochaeta odontotermitis]|nr:hypothetical protein JY97_17305 [Alkalispirochaeta odontotermitis]CAB1076237.1 hypothetical protein D1AOALGA4SA_4035 [Olavius algarvensis Delta 1 endosymbiont]